MPETDRKGRALNQLTNYRHYWQSAGVFSQREVLRNMSDEFPHFPGITTQRQFEGYSPYQEALWKAFEDTYFARVGEYEHTRMPTPGKEFDEDRFRTWQLKTINAWASEATRDAKTRGLTKEDLPESLWLSLYERLLAAQPLKPTPYAE